MPSVKLKTNNSRFRFRGVNYERDVPTKVSAELAEALIDTGKFELVVSVKDLASLESKAGKNKKKKNKVKPAKVEEEDEDTSFDDEDESDDDSDEDEEEAPRRKSGKAKKKKAGAKQKREIPV